MTDRTKELLSVLGMSETEQRKWAWNTAQLEICQILKITEIEFNRLSLADLVFRLRDEAIKLPNYLWAKATKLVYEYTNPASATNFYLAASYFADKAQPIHWIIAALIAKELSKD